MFREKWYEWKKLAGDGTYDMESKRSGSSQDPPDFRRNFSCFGSFRLWQF